MEPRDAQLPAIGEVVGFDVGIFVKNIVFAGVGHVAHFGVLDGIKVVAFFEGFVALFDGQRRARAAEDVEQACLLDLPVFPLELALGLAPDAEVEVDVGVVAAESDSRGVRVGLNLA